MPLLRRSHPTTTEAPKRDVEADGVVGVRGGSAVTRTRTSEPGRPGGAGDPDSVWPSSKSKVPKGPVSTIYSCQIITKCRAAHVPSAVCVRLRA